MIPIPDTYKNCRMLPPLQAQDQSPIPRPSSRPIPTVPMLSLSPSLYSTLPSYPPALTSTYTPGEVTEPIGQSHNRTLVHASKIKPGFHPYPNRQNKNPSTPKTLAEFPIPIVFDRLIMLIAEDSKKSSDYCERMGSILRGRPSPSLEHLKAAWTKRNLKALLTMLRYTDVKIKATFMKFALADNYDYTAQIFGYPLAPRKPSVKQLNQRL